MRLLRGPGEKYLLIINPMSRMGRGLRQALWLITRLVIRRIDFEAALTKRPGHAEKIVADYDGPVDVVVAIGGDGTIREVVNGIMKRGVRPALAVMPAGRGNDFSSLIGIGRNKKRALRYLLSSETAEVDLLRFNGRYASNVVGIGYDAAVQEKSSNYKYFAVIRYLLNAVVLILKGPSPVHMRIRHDHGVWEGEFLIAVVGHTRKYAKHIRLFPGLRINGGVMKVAAIRPVSRPVALVLLLAAGVGLAERLPQVETVETGRVDIAVGTTTKAQSDGDLFFIGGGETLTVELVRNSLEVRAASPFIVGDRGRRR